MKISKKVLPYFRDIVYNIARYCPVKMG